MKRNWWKWLALLLLLYATTGGLLTPLSPGISAVTPDIVPAGKAFTLEATGYNTRLKANEASLTAWADNGERQVCATAVRVKDDAHLAIDFPAFGNDKVKAYTIYLNDKADGTFFLLNGLTMNSDTTGVASVTKTSCKPAASTAAKQDFHALPYRELLYETIRNLFFHVPMWFTMILLFTISLVASIRYLRNFDPEYDRRATQAINAGIIFGILGLITGSLWARVAWNTWWTNDVKLNGAAITMLTYLAYVVLRRSIDEEQKRARIAAVFNVFAYVLMLVFVGILPRMTDTLHPGNGGNPAFGQYDLDNTMRPVFYSAVLGWMLVGVWIYFLRLRMHRLHDKLPVA